MKKRPSQRQIDLAPWPAAEYALPDLDTLDRLSRGDRQIEPPAVAKVLLEGQPNRRLLLLDPLRRRGLLPPSRAREAAGLTEKIGKGGLT